MIWGRELRDRVLSVFSSERSGWIHWTKEQPIKNIITCPAAISDQSLFDLWVSAAHWVGLRFSKTTRYALVDLDKNSAYRNPADIDAIIKLMADNGIHLTRYRSSNASGGVHLCTFFDEPVKTAAVGALLHHLLMEDGYKIEGGQMEIYPSILRPKQAVRLPFQTGFAELDEALHVVDAPESPWEFMQAMKYAFATQFTLGADLPLHKIPLAYIQTTKRAYKQTVQAEQSRLTSAYEEWYSRGEELFHTGLTDRGTRHDALLDVGFYLFVKNYGYGQEEQREQMLQEWIAANHNDLSETWRRNQKQVFRDIHGMVYWEPKTGKRGIRTECFTEINMQRRADTKAAILIALPELLATGEIWKKNGAINLAVVIRATGKNKRTIYNHREFIQEQIAALQSATTAETFIISIAPPVHISEPLESVALILESQSTKAKAGKAV